MLLHVRVRVALCKNDAHDIATWGIAFFTTAASCFGLVYTKAERHGPLDVVEQNPLPPPAAKTATWKQSREYICMPDWEGHVKFACTMPSWLRLSMGDVCGFRAEHLKWNRREHKLMKANTTVWNHSCIWRMARQRSIRSIIINEKMDRTHVNIVSIGEFEHNTTVFGIASDVPRAPVNVQAA